MFIIDPFIHQVASGSWIPRMATPVIPRPAPVAAPTQAARWAQLGLAPWVVPLGPGQAGLDPNSQTWRTAGPCGKGLSLPKVAVEQKNRTLVVSGSIVNNDAFFLDHFWNKECSSSLHWNLRSAKRWQSKSSSQLCATTQGAPPDLSPKLPFIHTIYLYT